MPYIGDALKGGSTARHLRVLRRGLHILRREIAVTDQLSGDRLVAVMLTLVSEEVKARSHTAPPEPYGRHLTLAVGSNMKVSGN